MLSVPVDAPLHPPETQTALEQLLAAILLTEPTATVKVRNADFARVEFDETAVGQVLAVLIPTSGGAPHEEQKRLAGLIVALLAETNPGKRLHLVLVDEHGLELEPILKRLIPGFLLQFRRSRTAQIWRPDAKLKTVRGLGSSVLVQAVTRIRSGRVARLELVTAEREGHVEESTLFLNRLNQRVAWVAGSIAVMSCSLFALQMLWGGGNPYVSAPRMGAAMSGLISAGELWRLLSVMTLHGSVLHLIMNMAALFSFGTFLERFLGWRRFMLLYVLSGLGGSAASYLRPEETLGVGASGGIWGLMLAGAVLVSWPRGRLPFLVAASQKSRLWGAVAINVFYSFQPGVDLLAHFGGGLTGALLVASGALTLGFPRASDSLEQPRPPVHEMFAVKALAPVAGLLLAASVGISLFKGKPWELRGQPSLSRIELPESGAGIDLPLLLAPTVAHGSRTWTYGALQYDPVAFVISLPEVELTPEEAENPKAALQAFLSVLASEPIPGFSETVPNQLREREGVPYLYSATRASDGRTADIYWLIQGRRAARVMVLTSQHATSGWKAAADAIPFSLTMPPMDRRSD